MLTCTGCQTRRQRLWSKLNPAPDAVVITDPQHLVYFANYFQPPFTFRVNDGGAMLLLTPDGQATLIADNLLEPFARLAFVDEVVTPVWYRSQESAPHREAYLLRNTVEQIAKKLGSGTKRLGLEEAQAPHGLRQGLADRGLAIHVIDLDPTIAAMKRCKDEDELAVLRKSMLATAAGFAAANAQATPGQTELDVYHLVSQAAMNSLGDQASVYGDFVSGPRTAGGGGPPSLRKLEKKDLFLLDYSVVLFHYRSDYANTFVVAGTPSARQQEIEGVCLEALAAGEATLRAGVTGKEVYQAVRRVFEAKHLEEHFTHHAGHGLGLGHPEGPYLVPQSSDTLQAGNIVTLEPGLYFPNEWGMRFERNYLITEQGFEVLSAHQLGLSPAR